MSASQKTNRPASTVEFTEELSAEFQTILTPDAVEFIADLQRLFNSRRETLLSQREDRQEVLNSGGTLNFLPETAWVRESDWSVKTAPADLQDRRVEITGPVDRKMIINALNSGAKAFMADLEDAHSPTWNATLEGQINLRDAVSGNLSFTNPAGKEYKLGDDLATLIVRPRGWHLTEKHVLVDGERMSGALFDFGLYFFHNAKQLLENGSGPYFYLPKMENNWEAELWNDVFVYAESKLGVPHGSICCTILIETIPAAFEMDEILYRLKDYIVGLNCGRWDYIFSFIKRFHANPDWVLPDRSQVTMASGFLEAYSKLLIRICHRRGAHAMGGMAAQIPISNDPEADAAAKEKVRADKEREAGNGHDGTWVAHPGLVPIAMDVFNHHMPEANQIGCDLPELDITAADLLALPEGTITEAGVRNNVSAALRYMEAWLDGRGAVPIHHLMEDAATAEIARSQLWQWIRYPKGILDDGRDITLEMFDDILKSELQLIKDEVGEEAFNSGHYELAKKLMRDIVTEDKFQEFLTLPAYEALA